VVDAGPAPSGRSAAQPPAPAHQPPAAPPVSSKGIIAHPSRPGFGTVGRKVLVRANHFLVQFADNDICHYDVSSPPPLHASTRSLLLVFSV
jgi:eukaryotic translation initiation factor 2C